MLEQAGATLSKSRPEQVRPSVLVIDDDRDTCAMMCAFLSRDYKCEIAYDGEEALSKIKQGQYSVILADLMMPKLDGFSVLGAVSVEAPTTPVIVVSGVSETRSAIRAMRLGAFDYIMKPIEPDQVEISVRRALTHHEMVQAAHEFERRLASYAAQLETTNDGLTRALADLDSTYHQTISALTTALETRNVETRGHSDRVVAYSLKLGLELGLDHQELKALELGALFHDIGKIGVEDKILLKPAELSSDEWEEMRKHPLKGARIIEGIPPLRIALPVVKQHHEKWDGSGYPAGLSGDEIDIKARIFAVADALDAITSDRPYDPLRSFEEAAGELSRCAGKQFDPKVVEAFARIPLEEWKSFAKQLVAARAPSMG
jgi:cyclic di-GMP phosphodiesterase